MRYYSQRDPRWAKVLLGKSKTTTIGGYGCKLVSLSMIVGMTPPEVNEILKKAGAFFGASGDLMDDTIAAKALKLEYFGVERNIDKPPSWNPTVKEVDMSPAPGKQQHFVVRTVIDGKKCIVDPWTGTVRPIGAYPFVSYRLFKQK
jgi:hypothetical protein